jgi:hypothetical protein
MRTQRATRLAVLATVVVGVIGFGPGRADAAPATRVTRSSRAFSGFIQALHSNPGSPANFMCSLSGSDTRSVTATLGTTNIGAGRTWTCSAGSERVTLSYGLINTAARYPNVSLGRHQFSLSYTRDGGTFFSCKTWTVFSSLASTVTSTFATQERSQISGDNAAVCSDVFVQVSVGYTEGWSAS